MSVVSGEEVATHCSSCSKVNPNGVDLTPKQVRRIPESATIVLHGEKRGFIEGTEVVEKKEEMSPDEEGFYLFRRGGLYELRFPRVSVPSTCTGFAFPRSTVNRLGIIKLETAVFDSGYSGEPTQTIFTPLDALVHKDESLIQLVFIRNEREASSPYNGRYQNERGT